MARTGDPPIHCPKCGKQRVPVQWCPECGLTTHPELARLRAECERIPRLELWVEDLRGSVKSKQNCLDAALQGWNRADARIAELRAFVGLVLEYCEKGTPYWYGEDLKTRARKLLKETE